ncbi:MAG: hypothetical protein JW722_01165 [Demequinaceae bacterium]|nr:hypothetical protein [Demequinaceae bacterium]
MRFRTVPAIAAALLLSACGGGGANPTVYVTEVSPSGGPAPVPTVTVTASADDVPEYDYDRFFNVHIGDTHAQASAAQGYPITGETICPWFTRIVSNDNIYFIGGALTRVDNPLNTPFDTFFMRYYGDPNAVYTFPKNAEGIGIGSTLAELQAAYPTMYETDPDDSYTGLTYYVVEGPGGNNYRFNVEGGKVTMVFWGPGLSMQPGDLCAL